MRLYEKGRKKKLTKNRESLFAKRAVRRKTLPLNLLTKKKKKREEKGVRSSRLPIVLTEHKLRNKGIKVPPDMFVEIRGEGSYSRLRGKRRERAWGSKIERVRGSQEKT